MAMHASLVVYWSTSALLFFLKVIYSQTCRLIRRGEGDLHDIQFDDAGRSIVLTPEGLFGDSSPAYTLTIYPTDEFLLSRAIL
jgi:hypothetical protein